MPDGLQGPDELVGADSSGCVDVHEALTDIPDLYAVDAPQKDQEDDCEPVLETVLIAKGSMIPEMRVARIVGREGRWVSARR